MIHQHRGPRGAYHLTIGGMSDVRKARMLRGWSQETLAARAGCSVRAVREHERSLWPSAKEQGRLLHAKLLQVLQDPIVPVSKPGSETGTDGLRRRGRS